MSNLEKQLKNLQVGEEKREVYGNVPLAPKKIHPPGKKLPGSTVALTTNLRRLSLAADQSIYKYTISINLVVSTAQGEKLIEISKSKKSGAQHAHIKDQCRKVYTKVVQENEQVFKKGSYFYDQQANIYALQKIPNAENRLKFTCGASEDLTKQANAIRFDVEIAECEDTFQATTNDLQSTVNSAPALAKKTLIEALNQVLNGPPMSRKDIITCEAVHYLTSPEKTEFANAEVVPFNEKTSKYGGIGISSAVKVLKGKPVQAGAGTGVTAFKTKPDPTCAAYLITDTKKTTFHCDKQSLLVKVNGFKNAEEALLGRNHTLLEIMLKTIKGLQCYLNYGDHKDQREDGLIVKIKGFGEAANRQTFRYKDGEITVAAYFLRELGVRLRNPNYKTVVCKGKGGNSYFPIECLNVCNSQIARTDQMLIEEQEAAIKASATRPATRERETERLTNFVGLSGNIGNIVHVSPQVETVQGRVLPVPKIQFAKGVVEPLEKGTWKHGNFIEPKTLDRWEVIALGCTFDIKAYVSNFMRKGQSLGMRIAQPEFTIARDDILTTVFETAKKNGTRFLFFIVRDSLELHQKIKNFEQKYDILTQHVKETTARNTLQNRQEVTLGNVVAKTNVKLGGLNHCVVGNNMLGNKGVVYIGFETSQKNTASDAPITIGYSANVLKNHQMFNGGFYFVNKGSDAFGQCIKRIVRKVINDTAKNRGSKPETLFFYFNGVTEGQYGLMNEKYVNAIKDVCREFGGYRPHITIVSVSKTHGERIYKKNNSGTTAQTQNVAPGTVVDDVIVSPVVTEFLLTSHHAFQGTARIPKFTVIFDTSNIPLNELETITYNLCYLHEIVAMPVSLPAPLYIADRYAKRASNLFNNRGIARNPEYATGDERNPYDCDKINRDLTYDQKSLDSTRYNA